MTYFLMVTAAQSVYNIILDICWATPGPHLGCNIALFIAHNETNCTSTALCMRKNKITVVLFPLPSHINMSHVI